MESVRHEIERLLGVNLKETKQGFKYHTKILDSKDIDNISVLLDSYPFIKFKATRSGTGITCIFLKRKYEI